MGKKYRKILTFVVESMETQIDRRLVKLQFQISLMSPLRKVFHFRF